MHFVELREELKAQKESGEISKEEATLNYSKKVKILTIIDGDKRSFVPRTPFFQNFLIDRGMGDATEEQEVDVQNLDGVVVDHNSGETAER